jgi:hypothetical protein
VSTVVEIWGSILTSPEFAPAGTGDCEHLPDWCGCDGRGGLGVVLREQHDVDAMHGDPAVGVDVRVEEVGGALALSELDGAICLPGDDLVRPPVGGGVAQGAPVVGGLREGVAALRGRRGGVVRWDLVQGAGRRRRRGRRGGVVAQGVAGGEEEEGRRRRSGEEEGRRRRSGELSRKKCIN